MMLGRHELTTGELINIIGINTLLPIASNNKTFSTKVGDVVHG